MVPTWNVWTHDDWQHQKDTIIQGVLKTNVFGRYNTNIAELVTHNIVLPFKRLLFSHYNMKPEAKTSQPVGCM